MLLIIKKWLKSLSSKKCVLLLYSVQSLNITVRNSGHLIAPTGWLTRFRWRFKSSSVTITSQRIPLLHCHTIMVKWIQSGHDNRLLQIPYILSFSITKQVTGRFILWSVWLSGCISARPTFLNLNINLNSLRLQPGSKRMFFPSPHV